MFSSLALTTTLLSLQRIPLDLDDQAPAAGGPAGNPYTHIQHPAQRGVRGTADTSGAQQVGSDGAWDLKGGHADISQ
ncbi:hypothetical protein EON65_37830 [archaeon]|nr:MAG: hypothetical protein EON65_37830 [archaeon]